MSDCKSNESVPANSTEKKSDPTSVNISHDVYENEFQPDIAARNSSSESSDQNLPAGILTHPSLCKLN